MPEEVLSITFGNSLDLNEEEKQRLGKLMMNAFVAEYIKLNKDFSIDPII